MATDPFYKTNPTTTSIDQLVKPIEVSPSATNEVPNASPASPTAVAKTPQIITKQGSKITMQWFAIGCGVFALLFVGIIIVGLYSAISSPDSLSNLGLDADTVKSLLLIFALLFFGSLFFVGFGFAALNGYRIATVQWVSKIKFVIWLIIGIVMILISITLGTISIIKINNLSVSAATSTTNMIIPYIEVKKFDTKDTMEYGRVYVGTKGLKTIAPAYIDFQLNKQIFNTQILSRLWWSKVSKMILDCGNGQIIDSSKVGMSTTNFFNDNCLYLTKGTYNLSLKYYVVDKMSGNEVENIIDAAGSVVVDANWTIDGLSSPLSFNDEKDEMIIGTAPSKITIDAQSLFTDLNIPNIAIRRDMDGNGSVDKSDKVNFTYYYDTAKLYTMYYQIPSLGDGRYLMRFRVNAGDVPACRLLTQAGANGQYTFTTQIDEKWTDITAYGRDIIDSDTDEIITSLSSSKNTTDYQLTDGKNYKIRGNFTTTEWKQGSCESEAIAIGANNHQIITTITYRTPKIGQYIPLPSTGTINQQWNAINLTEVPIALKLTITDFIPALTKPNVIVTLGDTIINPSQPLVYVVKIDSEGSQTLKITVTDTEGKKSDQLYLIETKKKHLIWELKVSKSVGYDPLTVQLDASISQLNDPNDEVVYFTWDFGDGAIVKNSSQGKINHTYRRDQSKEDGAYTPTVTIKTHKGFEDSISLTQPIIVKRPIRMLKLSLPSHPAQVAQAGDQVDYTVETDGAVKSMSWDFGNDKRLNCDGRECADTSMIYSKAGEYDVMITVDYKDHPPVSETIKIKVQ